MFSIPKKEKVYVKVTSDFDATGFMQPKTIIWDDGRVFTIDRIRDFRPAEGGSGDRYTVVIQGQDRFLFFERVDPQFSSRFGRWFVECAVS